MPETTTYMPGGAKRAWPLLFWISLLSALALLLCGCSAQGPQPSGQEPGQETRQAAEGSDGPAGGREQTSQRELGHPALGDADAPVVMVEYGDFQ